MYTLRACDDASLRYKIQYPAADCGANFGDLGPGVLCAGREGGGVGACDAATGTPLFCSTTEVSRSLGSISYHCLAGVRPQVLFSLRLCHTRLSGYVYQLGLPQRLDSGHHGLMRYQALCTLNWNGQNCIVKLSQYVQYIYQHQHLSSYCWNTVCLKLIDIFHSR